MPHLLLLTVLMAVSLPNGTYANDGSGNQTYNTEQRDPVKDLKNKHFLDRWSRIRQGMAMSNISNLLGYPVSKQTRNNVEYWVYRDVYGQSGWVSFQIWEADRSGRRPAPSVKDWALPPAELPEYTESTNFHHHYHYD
jgi:hypothetical protein